MNWFGSDNWLGKLSRLQFSSRGAGGRGLQQIIRMVQRWFMRFLRRRR